VRKLQCQLKTISLRKLSVDSGSTRKALAVELGKRLAQFRVVVVQGGGGALWRCGVDECCDHVTLNRARMSVAERPHLARQASCLSNTS
jgi:hypothetical protein